MNNPDYTCDSCGKEERSQYQRRVPNGWVTYVISAIDETKPIEVLSTYDLCEKCRVSFLPRKITKFKSPIKNPEV